MVKPQFALSSLANLASYIIIMLCINYYNILDEQIMYMYEL